MKNFFKKYIFFFAAESFKHLKGIKASSEGFEQIDNTKDIEPGLIKLFQLANLDIGMIHDPKYQEEVKNFKKQNESTLARIGSVSTKHKTPTKSRRHQQKSPRPKIEDIPEDEYATHQHNSHSGGKSRRNLPPPPPPPKSGVALVRLQIHI